MRFRQIVLGIAILVFSGFLPFAAEARIRLESPDFKPNRRTIFQNLEQSDLYRSKPGDKETTHTSYRKSQRDARQQMILKEIHRRGNFYKGEEIEPEFEETEEDFRDKRTKEGSAYTPRAPLRVPEAATTKALRIRGLLRETTISEEACRGLSGARLARCRSEHQQGKEEGAPQMIEETKPGP